jgi:hypothetical protein
MPWGPTDVVLLLPHEDRDMRTHLLDKMRELDRRTNDGIDVRLLWHPEDGRIAVAVADSKKGTAFDFEVREPHRARHAFQHPFAYAELSYAA